MEIKIWKLLNDMKKVFVLIAVLMISVASFAQKIMIMGGDDCTEFLGFLNANPFDSRSIWNQFGTYGNEYNTNCIWNQYGTYGNEYSMYSPWNAYSSNSPILIDKEGNYYGKFNASNKNEAVKMICKLAPSIMKGTLELDDAYYMIFGKDVK